MVLNTVLNTVALFGPDAQDARHRRTPLLDLLRYELDALGHTPERQRHRGDRCHQYTTVDGPASGTVAT